MAFKVSKNKLLLLSLALTSCSSMETRKIASEDRAADHFSGYIGGALYCPEQDLTVVIEVTSDKAPLIERKEAELCRIKRLFLPQSHCGSVGG